MAGRALWQNLKALVDCDKQILEIKKNIDETQSIQENNQRLIAQIRTTLDEKKQRIHARKKNVALQELNTNALKTECDEKRERISTLSNPKEYKALEKELAMLTRQSEEQEDILLKAWSDLERVTKQLDEEAKQNDERIAQLHEDSKLKDAVLAAAQETLAELLKKRGPTLESVPTEWQIRYERMKYTIQEPIVPIIQESCSACYYSVLQQDVYKLKNADVMPCRNCYRFLYYDSEVEKKAHEATF